jgi:cysteinyl-tRNA synthetase
MIRMIERLIGSGHAYAAEGHALFRVASYARYGALSRRSRADLIAGARVEIAPYKADPGDFVLWKPSTPDQPGWDSPWGRGRPGWHIECSAMSEETLGETFDIHGGGLDLIFPHHENEIAQSVCAHDGHPFARTWLHNGMLTVGGAKMAKSEGNFVTVRDALAERPDWQRNGEILRLALLGTHYRDPLDWTEDRRRQENQRLFRFYTALNRGRQQMLNKGVKLIEPDPTLVPAEVREALDDDLNSPLALSRLQELGHEINISRDQGKLDEVNRLQAALVSGGQLMGLLNSQPQNWLRDAQASDPVLIDQLVADRVQARKDRNFAEADRIRARLLDLSIVLEDNPDGTSTPRRK